MVKIDFDDINDKGVYEAFQVDGNEAEALNDSYLELFELIGRDAMLKLFTHYPKSRIISTQNIKTVERPVCQETVGLAR